MNNPSLRLDNCRMDENNHEFRSCAYCTVKSPHSDAILASCTLQDACRLESSSVCRKSVFNPIKLVDLSKFTNISPIPPICKATLSSSVSKFTTYVEHSCIQMYIKTIRNSTIRMEIDQTITIDELKHAIYANERISPCHQRLVSGCREFQNDLRLSVLCMADNSTITLLGRLMGGNPEDNPRIMPVTWWFGFGRSYQDGRAGEEGRICHVLSEFEFDGDAPKNWYSDHALSEWRGIELAKSPDCMPIVTKANLRSCSLRSLPDSVDKLSRLAHLNVYCNVLTVLPGSIGNLSLMTHLILLYNHLTKLPDSIGNLSSLMYLIASLNQLTSIPDSIGNLTSLVELWLSSNRLTSLPSSIGNLSRMTHLNVSQNLLDDLPESVNNLVSLTRLGVSSNPMTSSEEGKDEISRRFGRAGLNVTV